MDLLIVESPAKAGTIKKYLGRGYRTLSSYGHIRDLPRTVLGVDLKNNYRPKYQIISRARKNIKVLKEAAKKSKKIYLATDYDREGEAIAWHLAEVLHLRGAKRISFYEITKKAIEKALKNPRRIDMDLVDAQQARRILDRLVGYKLSPFLWQKVARGLSAGRVQSVAVRLVVEKENEIRNFNPKKYFIISVLLSAKDKKRKFSAELVEIKGKKLKKFSLKKKKEVEEIKQRLKRKGFIVYDLKKREKKINPPPPYMTSTMQRDASFRLGYSPKKTMYLAQRLYEAGHITYMRTDSLSIAAEARRAAREKIRTTWGNEYLSGKERLYKTKQKNAQEAHEAIRPTHINLKAEKIKNRLAADQLRLYNLISNRFFASQMKEAIFEELEVGIVAGEFKFKAQGRRRRFAGFMKVYPLAIKELQLPDLKKKERLILHKINAVEKETKPPLRYSEATLIKELEKRGIGRPSTYAPILTTIQSRGYVEKDGRFLCPTETGEHVNEILVKHFPEIVDYTFTEKMENDLDKIAAGKNKWTKVIDSFWQPFQKNLTKKSKELKKETISEEKTNRHCPKCGKELIIKYGRFGRFIACSGYPKCKYVERMKKDRSKEVKEDEKTRKERMNAEKILAKNKKCLKCGKKMVVRKGKFGFFLGCSAYPQCDNIIPINKNINMKCPDCGKGEVVERRTKRGKIFWGCSRYPKCKWASWTRPKQGNNK